MVSVNYSASSAAALNSLRDINKQIEVSQKRIASGYKVASASDNASVWATATKLKSESASNSTLMSALSTSQGKAKGTVSVLDSIANVLSKMKQTLSLGYDPAANYGSIDAQIAGLQDQITNLTSSATIGGSNWVTTAISEAVTTSVTAGSATTMTFSITDPLTKTGDPLKLALAAMSTTDGTSATSNITLVNNALAAVTKYSTKIAGWADTVDTIKGSLKIVDDIRKSAISDLIDTDMEEESARVNALQVQQQLAYQALSIGNSSAQNILRLFQ